MLLSSAQIVCVPDVAAPVSQPKPLRSNYYCALSSVPAGRPILWLSNDLLICSQSLCLHRPMTPQHRTKPSSLSTAVLTIFYFRLLVSINCLQPRAYFQCIPCTLMTLADIFGSISNSWIMLFFLPTATVRSKQTARPCTALTGCGLDSHEIDTSNTPLLFHQEQITRRRPSITMS